MPNKTLRRAFITAAWAIGLSVAASAGASAAVDMRWDPSATGLSPTGAFTFNGFQLGDYATIVVPPIPSTPGSVSEHGFLLPTVFQENGSTVAVANAPGTFGLYFQYTTTSHLNGTAPNQTGAFDTVSGTFYAYSMPGGPASVSFSSTTSDPTLNLHGGTAVALATISGPVGDFNNAGFVNSQPFAGVNVDFTPTGLDSGFFVSPSAPFTLILQQVFTNPPGVTRTTCTGPSGSQTCYFQIGFSGAGGGGSALFVPEPASIGVLGLGLAALGFVRRRKSA